MSNSGISLRPVATPPDTPTEGVEIYLFTDGHVYAKGPDGVARRMDLDPEGPCEWLTSGEGPGQAHATWGNRVFGAADRAWVIAHEFPWGMKFNTLGFRMGTIPTVNVSTCAGFAIYSYDGATRHWVYNDLDATAQSANWQPQIDLGATTILPPGKYVFYLGINDAAVGFYGPGAYGVNNGRFVDAHIVNSGDGNQPPASLISPALPTAFRTVELSNENLGAFILHYDPDHG